MPSTLEPPILASLRREVARFLAVTRRRCELDLYAGRRAHRRHHRSWPMLIAPLDRSERGDLSVALVNASQRGFAFRSPYRFLPGVLLGVKLFWHDPRGFRVPAVVRHCEPAESAFVVGCEFLLDDEGLAARALELRPRWYEA